MRPVIYGRSVLGWVCNPLEWVPLGSPDPPSGPASLDPQLVPWDYPAVGPSGVESSLVLLLTHGPEA
jgi:hypothetical protein